MGKKIKTLQDVVDWNLCIGCGACAAVCQKKGGVRLIDIGATGIRPHFEADCLDCTLCLSICPGIAIDADDVLDDEPSQLQQNLLIGTYHAVFEGHAVDSGMRFRASSGGIVSALATYCLEHENTAFVVHTGMDKKYPWKNITVTSRTREEVLAHTGSRYCTSSPCSFFAEIEQSEKPCVFIGKPCDVAALAKARRQRPALDAKVGIALSFFCAGTPCSDAVRELAEQIGAEPGKISSLHYRGQGWPGSFRVETASEGTPKTMAYLDAWKTLAKRRPFRCHLCPDGLGQLADITSGDAWNKYSGEGENPGLSHVIARTAQGKRLLEKAQAAGYVALAPCSPDDIVKAQGLVLRKTLVFGRLLVMKFGGIPVPQFDNFQLFKAWIRTNPVTMIGSISGTLKRMILRKLWRKSKLFYR